MSTVVHATFPDKSASVQTGNFTAVAGRLNRVSIDGGTYTVTLPLTSNVPNERLFIMITAQSGVNYLQVDADGGDTIDGTSSVYLQAPGYVSEFYNDGAGKWFWLRKGQVLMERNNPSSYDFTTGGTLVANSTFNTITLSAVSTAATQGATEFAIVYLLVRCSDNTASNKTCAVKTNGNSNTFNAVRTAGYDSKDSYCQGFIKTDANRQVEAYVTTGTNLGIVSVLGWNVWV